MNELIKMCFTYCCEGGREEKGKQLDFIFVAKNYTHVWKLVLIGLFKCFFFCFLMCGFHKLHVFLILSFYFLNRQQTIHITKQ